MKKIYRGTKLFIIVSVIIIIGSAGLIWRTGYQAAAYTYHLLFVRDYTMDQYKSYMDELFSQDCMNNLTYHDQLMDINSANLRISGVTYIPDKNLVKMDNGYLTFGQDKITNKSINKSVNKINELYKYASSHGIGFTYVACPVKGYDTEYPSGIENNVKTNCDRFYSALNSANIPTLILQHKMEKDALTEENAFFITDHHWKPTTGFWATEKILKSLESQYGFTYNKEYCKLDNYNIKTYQNWFLGSQGKKVGQYFTELGTDDIDLITPKFETSYKETQPLTDEVREGSFADTVLYTDLLSEKDLYNSPAYGVYSGGDARLQIYQNNNSANEEKILVMRDSFGCVVTPFLSLQFNTLYSVDLRADDYITEKMINIYDIIEKYKPDYIIMLYNGVAGEGVLNY